MVFAGLLFIIMNIYNILYLGFGLSYFIMNLWFGFIILLFIFVYDIQLLIIKHNKKAWDQHIKNRPSIMHKRHI